MTRWRQQEEALPACKCCGARYRPRWINNKPGATLSLCCSVECSRHAERLGGKTSELPWVECEVCGSSFMTKPAEKDGRLERPRTNAKFCSPPCMDQSTSSECGHCGKAFCYRQSAKPREYCTRKCRDKARRLRIPCLWCGKLHKPGETVWSHHDNEWSTGRGRSLCCSLRCTTNIKVWFGRTSPLPWKECEGCGDTFYARPARQYCSAQCRERTYWTEERRAAARERTASNHECDPFGCKECGVAVAPEYGDKRRGFCSTNCQKRWCRKQPWYKEGKARARRQRRARLLGSARVESVSLAALLERDRWRCGICRKPIRRDAEYPNPMSPTVDHIVPLAKGGEHTYRNTQPAHFICNSKKSDGVATSQTRLFGMVYNHGRGTSIPGG